MTTLYHVNHSCKDLVPGTVFNLLPIKIAANSEHAAAYGGWKQAFPNGLSVFGFRHMTPEQTYGEVPESKREIEWQCEFVRRKYFSHMKSRYQAFFALATLEEAVAFREGMNVGTGMIGSIWEIEATQIHHRGDMRLLTRDEANLRTYWEGKPLAGQTPIWECMVVPPVKMIRCVLAEDQAKP